MWMPSSGSVALLEAQLIALPIFGLGELLLSSLGLYITTLILTAFPKIEIES
jgi:hypothetical protein